MGQVFKREKNQLDGSLYSMRTMAHGCGKEFGAKTVLLGCEAILVNNSEESLAVNGASRPHYHRRFGGLDMFEVPVQTGKT
jgi:hypothetical protein